ncbi:sugar transporter ERD6-like protein 5 isoform X3 [Tanacetum coccineum]
MGSRSEEEEEEEEKVATCVVVLSTLVSVCGSFVYGSAVNKSYFLTSAINISILQDTYMVNGNSKTKRIDVTVGFSSPAQTGMMDDLGLSLEEYSVFGSILTIGAMVGAVMSGKIADRLGRRGATPLQFHLILYADHGTVSDVLFIRVVSWLLDAGRLLIGYGIGVISYVVPVYIAEITPKNLRGAFTYVNQLMIAMGISVMWLVGIVISWRTLAFIGAIPCLLQMVGLFFIPESPRWLAKNGRWKDSEFAIQRLRGENAEISEEVAEIRVTSSPCSFYFPFIG